VSVRKRANKRMTVRQWTSDDAPRDRATTSLRLFLGVHFLLLSVISSLCSPDSRAVSLFLSTRSFGHCMVLASRREEATAASRSRLWIALVVVLVAVSVAVSVEVWWLSREESGTTIIQRLLVSHVALTRLTVVARQLFASSSTSIKTQSTGGRVGGELSRSFTSASTPAARYSRATQQRGNMEVVLVPVHQDNYAYLLIDKASNVAAAVDPAEPVKVLAAANERNLNITTILTTHHHWCERDRARMQQPS